MAMGRVDLRLRKGSTFRQVFPLSSPLDPAQWSARGQVRLSPSSPVLHTWDATLETVAQAVLVAAGWPATADTQCLVLTVPASVSSAWTWPEALYDVELFTAGDAAVVPALAGHLFIDPEVTTP